MPNYIAVKKKRKGKQPKLIKVIRIDEEKTVEKIKEKFPMEKTMVFEQEAFKEAMTWGGFNFDGYISSIIQKENVKERLQKDVEEYIRIPVITEAVRYLTENKRVKLVKEYDNGFENSKHSDSVIREYDNGVLLDKGDLKPLEFNTLKNFMYEPTAEIKTEPYNDNKIIKALQVCDVIAERIEGTVKKKDFCKEIFNGIYDIEGIGFELPEELIPCMHGLIDEAMRKRFDILIPNIIQNILLGHIGSLTYENFFQVYEEGCRLLGIEQKYQMEHYESENDHLEEVAYNKLLKLKDIKTIINSKDAESVPEELEKKARKLNRQIRQLADREITRSDSARKKFHSSVSGQIKEAVNLIKKAEKEETSVRIEIVPILKKLCMVETAEYLDKQILVNMSDLLATNECIREFINEGILYVSQYSYIKFETKNRIRELIPASPELEYPMARDMKRHFIIHYGPTNSGKTYHALERLKQAETGTYLGPLRLLALEVQDKLNSENVLCSLLTGEEEEIIDGAGHVSSTVEKADMFNCFDVCVIDECQMINDEYRGFAWSRAILGIQAKEIHLCMAPEAKDLCIKLIELCGDTYELMEHNRRSKLEVEKGAKEFALTKKYIEEGDAIIVFSKKKVLQVAAELISRGIKTSLIYGNLPYSVRKKQVERFLNHETEVVVSTDAIGMGINLPVRRIVFLETQKYNGKTVENLTIPEIKQIAGRAGRNKETGYVQSVSNLPMIKKALISPTQEVNKAYLGFSDEIISIDAPISDILKVWKSIPAGSMFKRMDIDRFLNLDQMLYVDVKKKDKLKMITIPFDDRNDYLLSMWMDYCHLYEQGKDLYLPKCKGRELQQLEEYYKGLDLYYAFSKNFGYRIDLLWLKTEKESVSDRINAALLNDLSKHQRRCRECGRPLRWDHPFAICEKCYYSRYDDWYY